MSDLEGYRFKITCYENGELAIQCGAKDSEAMEYLSASLEEVCQDYSVFIDTYTDTAALIPALESEGYGILTGRNIEAMLPGAKGVRYVELLFKKEKLREMDEDGFNMYEAMRKETVKVIVPCSYCQKEYEIEMKVHQCLLYQEYIIMGRYHIQDIFPDKEAPVRELLSRNHMCGECWTRMFGEPEEGEDD